MRLLRGRDLESRYWSVADLIPTGASVVELCCGCGYLYEKFLRGRVSGYLGIDLLPSMLARLQRRGVPVRCANVLETEIPAADYIVMLGSLYHFREHASEVISRMARSGTGIVLEPVHNLSQSRCALVKQLACAMSFIGGTSSDFRFDEESLAEAFRRADVTVLRRENVLGGSYVLHVFKLRK
jgi:hypothetical protein